MNTTEMYIEAQKTGAWYKSNQLHYNKSFGFVDSRQNRWPPDAFTSLNIFMECEWKPCNEILTRAATEKKFNITIVG